MYRLGYIKYFTYIGVTKKHRYTMTKIALKSDRYSFFGGIFYVMDEFPRLGMDTLIDRTLGLRSNFCGYQYSEIISRLFWIYFCGGDYIEDIGTHLGFQLELRPGTTIPNPAPFFVA